MPFLLAPEEGIGAASLPQGGLQPPGRAISDTKKVSHGLFYYIFFLNTLLGHFLNFLKYFFGILAEFWTFWGHLILLFGISKSVLESE